MMLLRKLLRSKLIKYSHFLCQNLSLQETLSHEHILTDEQEVRHNHDNWPKKSLQVVWQFRSASVTWIHGDEDGALWVNRQICTLKEEPFVTTLNSELVKGSIRYASRSRAKICSKGAGDVNDFES